MVNTRHTRLTRNAVINLTEQVGKLLAKHDVEIIFVPDTGVAHFVVKAYKKAGGPKIIGLVPKDPEPFGVMDSEYSHETQTPSEHIPDLPSSVHAKPSVLDLESALRKVVILIYL